LGAAALNVKQAVVVIHGIGEQRPMETVRGFVSAVVPSPKNPNKPRFWSKPDPMSELFELRKLTTPQSPQMPPTDFYEYYWAYQAEGTKIAHVLAWAWSLLVRRPSEVPKHLKPLWGTLWGLLAGTLVFLSGGYWGHLISLSKNWVTASYLLSLLSTVAGFVVSGLVVNYVGDAARYLNPRPPNIKMRRKIRQKGVELLRNLHDPKYGYDRIVIAGHSLGSVIAYDIIRHLWPQYNQRDGNPQDTDMTELTALESAGKSLRTKPLSDSVEDFRNLQLKLWQKELSLKNKWRVTDLVTIGSPLAHAALLLAGKRSDLEERQQERELPTCPPVPDDGEYGYDPAPQTRGREKNDRKKYVLHHAAVFACTRWTNLYFPASWGFFGDLVGGPLREIFGPGIRDVPVDSNEWHGLLRHTPLIHTHYWNPKTLPSGVQADTKHWALQAVQDALDLNSRGWLTQAMTTQAAAASNRTD
jgi:hypothetical protein